MSKKLFITSFALIIFFFTNYAQNWTELNTTGTITARSNASAIYIAKDTSMVVFGGITSIGYVDEIWRLNLNTNTWSLIPHKSVQAPEPRGTHICMYDSIMNRLLIWSGINSNKTLNDVWAFNFTDSTWTELFPDGNISGAPLKRYGTATIFDPVNRNIINFAGFTTSGRFDDTWEFDVDNLVWANKTNSYFPLKRCLTSQSFAKDRREMIVFGGQEAGNLNDIWTLNLDSYIWTNLTPTVSPIARHFSSNTYCENGYIVVYGGNSLNQGNNSGAINDIQLFSLDTKQWNSLPQGSIMPLARFGHTSIYIPSQDKMIVFGGQGTSSLYNDTWVYSGISDIINSIPEHSSTILSAKVFPNPSTDSRSISFYLPEASKTSCIIQNVLGGAITIPLPQELNQGNHTIDISEYKLTPGLYLLSIKTNQSIESIRFLVQ
jgi:hypothetical protein